MLIGRMENGYGVGQTYGLMGSCRVYEPVSLAPPSPLHRVVVSHFSPFTYSAGESLQYYRFCAGQIALPGALLPLIMSDQRTIATAPADLVAGLAGTELCVVEISTLDQLSCDGVFYNWNEVGLHFIRGKGPAYLRWWREVTDVTRRAASAEAVAQVLDTMHGKGEAVSPELERLLTGMRFATLSEAELEAVLGELVRESGKRFLFVAHLNRASEGPEMLADRRRLLEILRRVAARLGQACFDPTPTVAAFGYQRALLGDGADTHHYTPEFKPVLGIHLLREIQRVLFGTAAASRDRGMDEAEARTLISLSCALAFRREPKPQDYEHLLPGLVSGDISPAELLKRCLEFEKGTRHETACTRFFRAGTTILRWSIRRRCGSMWGRSAKDRPPACRASAWMRRACGRCG